MNKKVGLKEKKKNPYAYKVIEAYEKKFNDDYVKGLSMAMNVIIGKMAKYVKV